MLHAKVAAVTRRILSVYPGEFLPFDASNRREVELRSPWQWPGSIKSPVFVIEGTVDSNLDSLQAMARESTNPQVRFLEVQGVTATSRGRRRRRAFVRS